MNKAYQTMRNFWLDVNNLQHKKEVPQLGAHKVCIAGVEMAAKDDAGNVKHVLIAASSLGNASVYFENNSASGLGGFTGGSSSGPVREKALRMIQTAAKLADKLPVVEQVAEQNNPDMVTLFTVSAEGKWASTELKETDARLPENPFYGFFAYSQQLLGAFRQVQENAAAPQEKQTKEPTEQSAPVAEPQK